MKKLKTKTEIVSKWTKKILKFTMIAVLTNILMNFAWQYETIHAQGSGPLEHYEDDTSGVTVGSQAPSEEGSSSPAAEEGPTAPRPAEGESEAPASAPDPAPEVTPEPTPTPATTDSSDTLSDAKFNVRENLTLDDGEQAKKYFDPNNPYSPIVSFVLEIINFAITIMGSLAVILFIIAGFMFMFGMGNQQKVDEAKDVIKYAAIGMAVALLSYIIAIFVQSIFSAN